MKKGRSYLATEKVKIKYVSEMLKLSHELKFIVRDKELKTALEIVDDELVRIRNKFEEGVG
mgnify:CR=1 FL=1|tara:strand:+ start:222 stop:404 length:183 start_codon:yes stop_codon:yes gene_type:complete